MTKVKVAIVRCENYDEQTVYDALTHAIKLIGGIDHIIKPNEKNSP